MKPETAEKLLVWILRAAGVVCTLAIVPMLMPTAWAQGAHAAIGLGNLPGLWHPSGFDRSGDVSIPAFKTTPARFRSPQR